MNSKKVIWTGRIMSGFMVAFLLMDAATHLAKVQPVVHAFERIGWPIGLAVPLGIVELLCIAVYVFPRTSILGAILLTGYLGGAVLAHLRVGSPLFGEMLFPVYLGILLWGGLYLREARLRAFLPFTKSTGSPRAAAQFRGVNHAIV
jgi:hypothetical protein